MECPKCQKETPEDKQFCQNCLFNIGFWETYGTEYEEHPMPLRYNSMYKKKFMFSDKDWKKDIKARRSLPDGTVGRFKDGRRYG
jgi:hypothetical protein